MYVRKFPALATACYIRAIMLHVDDSFLPGDGRVRMTMCFNRMVVDVFLYAGCF